MSLRRLLSVAVATTALISVAQPTSAEDLRDAIILAYQTNPTLLAQRSQQRATDESYVQARGGLRPQVDASAGVGYVRQWPHPTFGSDESNSTSATISLSQPLYTGGRIAHGIDTAMAGVERGRENLRNVEQQIMLAVIQAYADVIRDTEVLRIRETNLGVLQRQLEEAEARFEVGEITRTDVAQSQARLAASEADLASARAQLEISRSGYTAVVGQAPGTLEPLPALPTTPSDFDVALDAALNDNPELRAAMWNLAAADSAVAAARSEYLPSAGLSASYGTAGTAEPFGLDDQQTLRAGVNVSVPLYAAGIHRSRVRQALEQSNTAQLGVEGARRAVLQDVASSYAQVLSTTSTLTASEQQVRAARIAAEGVRQEAQVGLRTTLDVLNQELELRNAEIAYVSAQRNRYIAQALLLSAIGGLEGPDLVSEVPAYNPDANFNRVRRAGGVPWEGLVEGLDRLATFPVTPAPDEPNAPIDDQLSSEIIRTAP
ncbi:TolC family outer membrane protein [Brevundimonas aveniformis]|uniref:TolC family outer membrane protein n=1 Tax=Brevundimonas aveniformis TaxID=370977 RepID=UPI0003FCF153|nr:TolC family outer membrane protein [Brevundimonas aveniformis]